MDNLDKDVIPRPLEITLEGAACLLRSDDPPVILDVREAFEIQICNLGDSLHVPTGEIPFRYDSLPRDRHMLVLCHHGVRSLHVTRYLHEKGWTQAQSVRGGIEAWSVRIDPTVPRY